MFNPNNKLANRIKEKGGFINAHAHFDRAYTVTEENMEKVVNYHLFDKWKFVDLFKKNAEVSIYINNMMSAVNQQIKNGSVGALTFVDIDTVCNFKALEAAQIVKKEAKTKGFELKICSQALKGVLAPRENKLLRKALELGYLDAIGGLPRADRELEQAHLDEILYLGKEYGKRVHVHVDQLNDSLERETELLAQRTIHWGMQGKVTAVHGISIAAHEKDYRQQVYKLSVEEMIQHGLTVAIGSDNIHDVYKPFSDGNMYTELKFLLECLHMYDIETLSDIATKNGRLVIGMEEYTDGAKI
jgi:cytosine/adenosine deaminase-related metal-dependent hydrolase